MEKKRVVVIGGGTGTHTVLRGLKCYHEQLDISAVVTMADSGGSTGRLRDEFGYLPVGDVRMALAALASEMSEREELVRELFLYRFAKGAGLSGHNFGNLLLVALTDILGSEEAAIRVAGRMLGAVGTVLPVTTEKVQLVATYDDGVQVVGEHEIDEPDTKRAQHRITNLSVTPVATIGKVAKAAIANADLIVLGPGDLYTSVLANCVVGGVAEAICQSAAKTVYVCNLMTKLGQTTGMSAADHLAEIETYLDCAVDYMLVNSSPLPDDLLQVYAADGEYPVEMGKEAADDGGLITADLLASEAVQTSQGDTLKRSLIRHDSDKLAAAIMKLV